MVTTARADSLDDPAAAINRQNRSVVARSLQRLCLDHGQAGSYAWPEVGFAKITIDLLQARFCTANDALTNAPITSALPTAHELTLCRGF
jgi:hypothetical protein